MKRHVYSIESFQCLAVATVACRPISFVNHGRKYALIMHSIYIHFIFFVPNKQSIALVLTWVTIFAPAVCQAQATSKLFFTTGRQVPPEGAVDPGSNSLKHAQALYSSCINDLSQSGDTVKYGNCIQKAQGAMQQGISLSRPKVLDDCKDAGYSTCFNSRVSASVVQVELAVSGSGVLIGDDGRNYLIATSAHVLDSLAEGEKGEVLWQGKSVGQFNLKDVWKSSEFDIGVIRLRSEAPPVSGKLSPL
jgi:S1-C subfamily serine protease